MKLGSEGSNLVKNNVIKFSDIREESNDGKGWNTSLFMCVKCLNRYIAMVYPSDWFTKDLVCPKCFRQGSLIVRNAEELELDDRAAALRIKDLEEEEKNKNDKHED
jgi:hypothetical protein